MVHIALQHIVNGGVENNVDNSTTFHNHVFEKLTQLLQWQHGDATFHGYQAAQQLLLQHISKSPLKELKDAEFKAWLKFSFAFTDEQLTRLRARQREWRGATESGIALDLGPCDSKRNTSS